MLSVCPSRELVRDRNRVRNSRIERKAERRSLQNAVLTMLYVVACVCDNKMWRKAKRFAGQSDISIVSSSKFSEHYSEGQTRRPFTAIIITRSRRPGRGGGNVRSCRSTYTRRCLITITFMAAAAADRVCITRPYRFTRRASWDPCQVLARRRAPEKWQLSLKLRKDDDWVKKCMEYEVEGSRPRGRPKRTWKEVVREDCQTRTVYAE